MLNIFSHYSRTDKLIIASGLIGNFLENFDIMICAFLVHSISTTFFPPNSITTNLFSTFNIFLVGYLSRPIGSLLIGLYADQLGRKKMLIFSIFMTGLCTAIIGIVPSYNSIGILSTLIFLFLRVLQNICVGGEYISSISYLIESAKSGKRGFYGSWVSIGFNCGSLLASILAFLFIYFINKGYFPEWSWRIIFFLAIIGMLIGMWIRLSLPESIGFILENSTNKTQEKREILKSAIALIKSYPYLCFSIITIAWLGVSETSVIFVYSTIHMTNINHFSQYQALWINSLSFLLLIIFIPIFGLLSDYFKRSTLLIIASFAFLGLTPIFFWYLSYGNFKEVLLVKLLFSIPTSCFCAAAPVLIAETFPTRLRCTSLALIYQTTASLAAGLSPVILLLFSKGEYVYQVPTYFLAISSILGIIGLMLFNKNPLKANIISPSVMRTKWF